MTFKKITSNPKLFYNPFHLPTYYYYFTKFRMALTNAFNKISQPLRSNDNGRPKRCDKVVNFL